MPTSDEDRLAQQIKSLHGYSACDVSDALLKLQKTAPGDIAKGGYLADIVPFAPPSLFSPSSASLPQTIVAPASTLKLVDKHDSAPSPELAREPFAIPPDQHWVDMTPAGSIVVIEQPTHQTCAAIGGIMATRMHVRGVVGCVVGGRVRDLAELRAVGLPVFALGRSTVGTGAEARVLARDCPVRVQGVEINPGDIIILDPVEGVVVVVPAPLLDDVLALMPTLVAADEKVKADVLRGATVFDAFRRHRG